ncbi:uncharacterized protein LOC113322870 isoform X1 [Papaver somniferum]|uniref:uncharacterized protein LOC113322870 isoform X1 n=1 Tax=Papaver somniferum TaxID=3469 RepID=UPI000E7004F8|nr:uncharacterized protein LOC113322870 isoform X1 [Papaver somniferum]
MQQQENSTKSGAKESMPGSELWTDGLICAFEFIRGARKQTTILKPGSRTNVDRHINGKHSKPVSNGTTNSSAHSVQNIDLIDFESLIKVGTDEISLSDEQNGPGNYQTASMDKPRGSHWVPIGWDRISELAQTVQVDGGWTSQSTEFMDDEDDFTVADVAAPYWERAAGPTWWCHVVAGHKFIDSWLTNAQWLHPAISLALRDESRLISDRMKHLLYEVPVRVAGGILFELLGQSAGDPLVDEDDIPIVLRSFKAQNFLISVLHVKGTASNINVLGITEVQELLATGGSSSPRTIHEVIAQLACRLSRWDDRLFRKSIFGAADEIELKFMDRRNHEDMNLFSVILNQELRKLSRQVIRVKWSLHAREEIVFELLHHLRGNAANKLLEGIRKNTREMIEEQEAVRGRLFTIQDVMQSTVRSWLQDKSLRVTHNLTVFGGCGLVLSIVTGLFGINVDGMPGAQNTPYAFALFSGLLILLGILLIAVGILYLGLKKPITEGQVQIRMLELQRLVKSFQHEAETHAQVRQKFPRNSLPPTAADMIPGAEYILIH